MLIFLRAVTVTELGVIGIFLTAFMLVGSLFFLIWLLIELYDDKVDCFFSVLSATIAWKVLLRASVVAFLEKLRAGHLTASYIC